MKTESILERMKILNGDANRKILELLLHGPKDFGTLWRESKLSRSTVFDGLKTLMDVQIVERKKLQDKSRGRPAYEYSIRDFYLPELTKTNLLDFFKGMELDAKSLGLEDLSSLDDSIEIFPFSIEFILYMMISSGFKFNHAFQVLIDLRSDLGDEIEYGAAVERIVEIAEKRYPIDRMTLKTFKERSYGKIYITSEKERIILLPEDLRSIAFRELGVDEFDADYLSQNIWMTLVVMGIYEIEYASLINLMYILAKNAKMSCKKTPYFYQNIVLPHFKGLRTITFIEYDKDADTSEEILWSFRDISKYVGRKTNFSDTKCNLLANIIVEKLSVMGLEKYNVSLLDTILEEFIRELRI